ncbi:carbon-nitrogen hydrolase family protein [Pacificimonas flava]|uniref:Carbon-nitrogen hydrolase n=1 Tax=Pacificimonas flava TaxID=1234595 RepID=M2U336_9SPHN|nr:carbon-nitrogen hydrolase family protein [Pacificimonas flava]EMD82392.1 Carbon-nitrogen hydrolase [Pacificimonas flava]MBB5281226.1 putative amidohydrolase [Pacificimonas flava]
MRIGLVQMTSGIEPARNAAALTGAIGSLASEGAGIVFTPEMSGCLDKNRERLLSHTVAENADMVLAAVRKTAAETGTWVALGSLAIKTTAASDRLINRSFLIDGNGTIVARYDKIHLFDVDLGGGETYGESKSFDAGGHPVVADTPAGRLGLSICYDLRFPRLYDCLSEAGADLLAAPAAFTRPTGAAHWHLLARTRAVENTAFVIAAAQTGTHEDGRATYGHSLVVDPWGEVLLDMGETPGTAICDIDLARVAEIRRRLPSRDHRAHIAFP